MAPADEENEHEPVDEAEHVIDEAAVFGGVWSLTDEFVDPIEVS
jgi:hypothetical protein